MKARSKELLERATSAMIAAIEVYNKPDFPYRAESFTILTANAWELLLKAKWLQGHNNRLSSLYVRQGGGAKRKRIKKTKAGNPFTHSLVYIANKLREEGKLNESAYRNVELLSELRDSSIHLYQAKPEIAKKLQEIAMAAVKNFNAAAREWFGEDLSRFNFYLMPLSFVEMPTQTEGVMLNRAEQRFLKFLSQHEMKDTDDNLPYAVAVNIELRFVRSKEKGAVPVQVTEDPNAPAVRLTEEQVRERYPWDYRILTERCRDRYDDFLPNQQYHERRKALYEDKRYVYIRQLDPGNPKSAKKPFFNPSIFNELDKYYRKRG